MKSQGIQKLYYSISEVAERTGLRPHVLRYWETEFAVLRPRKNRAGNRAYTERDVVLVERIKRLLRDEGYTINGARQLLEREAAEGGGDGPLAAREEAGVGYAGLSLREGADAAHAREELVRLRAFLEDVLRRLP